MTAPTRLCARLHSLTLTPLRHRTPPSTNPTIRAFTTTPHPSYKQPPVPNSSLPIPSASSIDPAIPPYPFGPRRVYKQSNTGLYGAARIRTGNIVSSKHEVKNKRKWRPNVQSRRLWSAALGVHVRTRVTTRVLRTIDKAGGLDAYLLGDKTQRLKDLGPWGWRLRWRLMQTPAVQEQFARQRAALGLSPRGEGEIQAEVDAVMPAGEAGALAAETQALLEGEGEFDLSGEPEKGFMKEVPKSELKA